MNLPCVPCGERLDNELAIYTFGGLRILSRGVDITAEMPAKIGALIVYLACEPCAHARTDLCGLLWSSERLTSGALNLRVALSSARRRFGATLAISRHAVTLSAETPLWLDAWQLQTTIADLLHAQNHLAPWDVHTACQLDRTLALYRGDFLQGSALSNALRFDAWAKYQQAKFKALAHRAYHILCDYYLSAGDFAPGLDAARRWVAVDPLDAAPQRLLMQLYAEAGRTQDALHSFESYQQFLHEALHIAPDQEMQTLYHTLRRQDGAPVASPAPAPPPNNIDPSPAPLSGRQTELLRLTRLVAARAHRCVTVTGDDGIGKTHLVQTLAARLLEDAGCWRRFPDGVFWLTYPAPHAEEDIAPMLAAAVQLGAPDAGFDGARELTEALASSALLLILDDAPVTPAVRTLLDQLLHAAPGVMLLLTARAPLGVDGEHVAPLRGLSLPLAAPDAGLESSAAYQLLTEHAAAPKAPIAPETTHAVVRICQLTGGAPLALRLAGALSATCTWCEIADMLEQQHAAEPDASSALERIYRHLFELAWQGMDSWFQRAYLRLSLFADAFSEQTAGAAAWVMPEHLSHLLQCALIERAAVGGDAPHYRLHPVLRRLARERVSALAAGAYHWHADYFTRFVKEHDPGVGDISLPARLEALRAELGEIYAVFAYATQQQCWGMLKQIAPGIAHYFVLRGVSVQGQKLLDDAIAKAVAGGAGNAVLAVLYAARAMVHNRRTAYREAVDDARAALERSTDDHETRTIAELEWGRAAFHLGEYAEARLHLERVLALTQGAGQPHWEVRALTMLGLTLLYSGEHSRGVQLTYTAFHLSRKHQLRLDEARLLNQLGMVFYYQGRYTTAQQYFVHAQRGAEAIGNDATQIAAQISLGAIAYQLGDAGCARHHYEAALGVMRTSGERSQEALVVADIGLIAHQLGHHRAALAHLARAERLAAQRGQRDSEAFALTWQGAVHMACAQLDLAEDCFGKALQVRQALGQTQQVMEPLAGLVQVALARQDATTACAWVDRILPGIQSPSFVGAVDIFGVYWSCYQALQRAGDGRACEVLADAYHSLLARAAQLEDEPMRRRYLEATAVHRAIIEAYRHKTEAASPKPG